MGRVLSKIKDIPFFCLTADLWEEFGWRCVVLLVLILANGLLEGMALILLFPLLGELGIGENLAESSLSTLS